MVSLPQISMPTNMSHSFSDVPRANIPRSAFKRTWTHKTTFDSSYLIPIMVDEVLPGDTFNLDVSTLARLATPLKPIMDNLYLDTFFFFVPNRLIWSNWEKMNGAQDNPDDSTDFLVPQIVSPASTGWAVGTLSDYFGLPTGIVGLSVSSLWHRAYNLIWNKWFRDQNLQDSVVVDLDDGPDTNSDYVLLKRGKRHDYFTSCLPWPQKGPGVEIPLGTSAPVLGIGVKNANGQVVTSPFYQANGTTIPVGSWVFDSTDAANGIIAIQSSPNSSGTPGTTLPAIYADLSSATAATINSLREAFQTQILYERDARGGTRYVEILNAHFGVTSPDFRLQRPEYLGGNSTPIIVNPIVQNSATGVTGTPQGNLAAIGTASGRTGFTKSFVEHGVIIGLASVRADLTYQQGIPRMFSRRDRFDFYWPALAHIGEQAVLNKEIYAQATADDNLVFGYQERWAEYRYGNSRITGQFRSTYATSLDTWHLSQEFGSLPVLNDEFIEEDVPLDRVIAVPTEPHFIFDSFFRCNTVRPMPVYSVPGLIDHF